MVQLLTLVAATVPLEIPATLAVLCFTNGFKSIMKKIIAGNTQAQNKKIDIQDSSVTRVAYVCVRELQCVCE